MKFFIHFILLLLIAAALTAAGWACRTLWFENRRLIEENAQLDVSRIRFATEKECCEARVDELVREKNDLVGKLSASLEAKVKAEGELARLTAEVAKLQNETKDLRSQIAECDVCTKGTARVKKTAKQSRSAENNVPEAAASVSDDESLKSLLEMTDKAPRR